MPNRPAVVAFDSLQTLFSLEPVRQKLIEMEMPSSSLELWFARTLRDGFALTLTSNFKPFMEVAASQLELLLSEHSVDPSKSNIQQVMRTFWELNAYPDAEPALSSIKESGLRVVIITNGSKESTNKLLDKNNLSRFVYKVYSIDEIKVWKPHPSVYMHVADSLNLMPSELGMIAVHSWDILGASEAGFVTGWSSRLERRFAPACGRPDTAGTSLTEVVRAMLDLPVSSKTRHS